MTAIRIRLAIPGLILLVGLAAAGCDTFAPPHQAWTEARVEGRIVDAATREPIANATISRVRIRELGDAYPSEKGSREMQRRPTVATSGRDGQFVLNGERTAFLFLESFPSYAVTLQIQSRGYTTLQQQFTNVFLGTNGQVPLVQTGDIGLVRTAP